jgi:hypothetical protein
VSLQNEQRDDSHFLLTPFPLPPLPILPPRPKSPTPQDNIYCVLSQESTPTKPRAPPVTASLGSLSHLHYQSTFWPLRGAGSDTVDEQTLGDGEVIVGLGC